MPKSITKMKSDKKWDNSHYKKVEVNFSINDHSTIKQYCMQNGLAMSGFIYDIIIKAMAERGIRLEGTATRDVSSIIEGKEADKQKV